jgi:hypothetical protein
VCEGRSELVVVQDLIGVCHIQTGEPKGMWSYHGNFRERIRKTDKLTDKLEVFCWDRHITIWTTVLPSETHDGLGGVYDMNVCELVSVSSLVLVMCQTTSLPTSTVMFTCDVWNNF